MRWAKTLPFLNVAQVYEQVIGQLNAVSGAEFSPRERATIAELMREQVMHLHTELARRYAGKPQPAVDRELEAAEEALALWSALWEQYSACLKPLLEGDPDLAGVKAKILQRGLHVGKQLLVVHGLSRRVPAAAFWQELHAYYRLAEILDCTVTAVSDDLNPHAVGTSCYSMYMHALLMGLADPFSMSVRQIELADRWLGQWARKVFPYDQERETEGPVIIVDLDSATGAELVAGVPASPPASLRYCYPGKLAMSVRGRLKRLSTGANPAELQLGHDVSVEQCVALLTHLDEHWYQRAPARPDAPPTRLQLCGGGVQAAYFRVGGRTFDRQDPLGRMSFQGTQHLQTLGALTDYDRNKEEAERNWPWERWTGRYDWTRGRAVARRARAAPLVPRRAVHGQRRRAHASWPHHARRAGRQRAHRGVARAVAGQSAHDGGASAVACVFGRPADAGDPAVGNARGEGERDRAVAHVQPGTPAALDGRGPRAQSQAHAARAARRRLRARGVRGNHLSTRSRRAPARR